MSRRVEQMLDLQQEHDLTNLVRDEICQLAVAELQARGAITVSITSAGRFVVTKVPVVERASVVRGNRLMDLDDLSRPRKPQQ